jgi:hypothetical protein
MFGLIGFIVVLALAIYGALEFYKTFRKKNAKTDWTPEDYTGDFDWSEYVPSEDLPEYFVVEDRDEDEFREDDWDQDEQVVEPPPVKKPRKTKVVSKTPKPKPAPIKKTRKKVKKDATHE